MVRSTVLSEKLVALTVSGLVAVAAIAFDILPADRTIGNTSAQIEQGVTVKASLTRMVQLR